MKNEPTHLEIFQSERIKALEEEVNRLKIKCGEIRPEKTVIMTLVHDPIFEGPAPISATGSAGQY